MQHPVGHFHRDRGQLQHLMGVVRRGQDKRRVATWTPLGPQFLERRGRSKRLAMARMAQFPARFLGCGGGWALARLLIG